jgi:hypothetical protein
MPTQDEIDQQFRLLEAYRSTLLIYLEQRAKLGAAFTPPGVINGINESKKEIQRVKDILRNCGQTVIDHPNDDIDLSAHDRKEDSSLIPISPLIPTLVIDVLSNIDDAKIKEKWSVYSGYPRFPTLPYSRTHRRINTTTYEHIIKVITDEMTEIQKWVRADYDTVSKAGFDKKKYMMALVRDEAELKSWNVAKEIYTENQQLFINNIEEFKDVFKREYRRRILQTVSSSLHELDDARLHDFICNLVSIYYTVFKLEHQV